MAQSKMKFYAYNTSVSCKTEVYAPGAEIPLEVIRSIPRVNLRSMLAAGQIITQNQREAIEEASRIAASKDADQLPPIGCGKDKFIDEIQINPGSTGGVGLGLATIKETRGEIPLREIEDFLDADGEVKEDFVDEPKADLGITDEPIKVPSQDQPVPDFADAPTADAVEGESEPPLGDTDTLLNDMFGKDEV